MTEPESAAEQMAKALESIEPLIEVTAGFRAKCVTAGFTPESAEAAAGELLVQSIRYMFARNRRTPSLLDLLREARRG